MSAPSADPGAQFPLRPLLDDLNVIICEMDPISRHFTFVSAGAERILGFPASRWTAERDFWPSRIHPDDRTRVVEYCASCITTGCDHEIEYRMLDARDQVIWLRAVVHVAANAAGEPRLHGVMMDFTAHRHADDALRTSEERFARFAEASVDGMIVHAAGRITDANRTAERMLGYREGELVGRSPLDLTVPAERPLLGAHIASGHEEPLTGHALRKDGTSFPVEVHPRTLRTPTGTTRVVVVRDTSDRQRAEDDLRDREARLRLVMQQIPAILWTTDNDGRFTSFTGRALEKYGDAPAGAIGRTVADVAAAQPNRDQMVSGTRAALAGRSATYQVTWGDTHFASHVEPLRDARGDIQGTIGLAVDVTESHRVAGALSESEARYRGLVESMPDGVAVHAGGRLVFINRAGARLLGAAAPAELVGRSILDFISPDTLPQARAQLRDVLERGQPVLADRLRLVHVDGTTIDVEVSAATIEYEGRPAVQIVFRDIGDRLRTEVALRNTELQLQQSQKLEAVGRLAGGIAHDFNNLLTVISAFTQMVMNAMAASDPRRSDLGEVQNAADRAAELTRQLLVFSRKQVAQSVVLDVNGVVEEIDKMLRRIIGEDVRLQVELAKEPVVVRSDRGQLEQVLVNLAVNARDAMPRGGTLTIRTNFVELTAAGLPELGTAVQPGRYARLDVRDTGVGMDDEVREHAFEPFFTTKSVGKGTGLGLPMVYGIVKQAGGYIGIHSAPNEGTTFSLFFPLATGEQPEPRSPRETTAPAGSETILLVEDEEGVREVTRRILEERGYRVIAAPGPHEAIAMAAAFRGNIHLLLTDVVMPRMGGRALATRLVAERPTMRTLFMTGYSDDEVLDRSIEDLGSALLFKPFTTEELGRAVRAMLDRKD